MSSTSSASKVTGLVSGFDTQSIVESFMAMEKVPMTKLEVKKQTEDLKLQAYQAVNTYLLKFKTSMNNLASKKLWNSKAATSTNEKVLTATANEFAVNGSYSFKVAQLATATQYMSKGFANKDEPLVKQKDGETPYSLGTINLASGKTRVDNSAELESLNGGKGVYRGSIRVTDASNTTSVIDLSSCTTLDDVVRTLNESTGAQISAYLKEGRLMIDDASNGTGSLKITNVGTGTTATDLGIVGTGNANNGKSMDGRNVYIMGNDTALSNLNDGLGVESGYFTMKVANSSGSYWDIKISTEDCNTVGDIVKKLNSEIELAASQKDAVHPSGLLPGSALEGLRFGVSEDGTSFALYGGQVGLSYSFLGEDTSSVTGQGQPVSGLGLANQTFTVTNEDESYMAFDRVLGGSNSPMLKSLAGARGEGVGYDSESTANQIPLAFNTSTPVSALNGGKGLDDLSVPLQIVVYEGGMATNGSNGKAVSDLFTASDIKAWQADWATNPKNTGNTAEPTVDDLINEINSRIEAYSLSDGENAQALVGLKLEWNASGNALTWTGAQPGYEYEVYGTVATSIGAQRNKSQTGTTLGMSLTDLNIPEYDGTNQDLIDAMEAVQAMKDSVKDFINGDSLITGNNYLDATGATMGNLTKLYGLQMYNDTEYLQVENPDYDADAAAAAEEAGDEYNVPQYIPADEPGGVIAEQYRKMAVDEETGLETGEYAKDEMGNYILDDDKWADATSTAAANTALDDAFSGTFTFTLSNGSTTTEVEISWDAVKAALGAGDPDFDFSKVSVDDFLEKANEVIAQAFEDKGYPHTPVLGINDQGTGFGWSGLNYFLDMEVSGGTMAALGMEKSFTGFDQATADSVTVIPPTPMIPGYSRWETITTENAGEHTLKELNLGTGLNLAAGAGSSLTFQVAVPDDTAEGGYSTQDFTIEVDDVIANLQAKGYSNLYNVTVEDYITALNEVTQPGLQALNAAAGLTGDDMVSFSWGIKDNGLALMDMKNVPAVNIMASDDAKTASAALGIGTGTLDFGATVTEYKVGNFNAATIIPGTVEGLGTIQMSLGSGDTVTLNTDGMTSSNTLADLIDKLNSELDALAAGTHVDSGKYSATDLEAFKNVRFTLNETGNGIAVDNTSNKAVTFHDTKGADGQTDNNYLAQDLGLIKGDDDSGRVEAYSFQSAGSINRKYVSRATNLDDIIGAGTEKGSMKVMDATGNSLTIPMTDAKTVGDVIDFINAAYYGGALGVYAELNETGDGIRLIESYNGLSPDQWPAAEDRDTPITITDELGGSIAKKLGIAGTSKTVTENGLSYAVIDNKLSHSFEVMSNDSLQDIMYRMSEAGYKAAIINDGSSGTPYRLSVAASSTGAANDFVIDTGIDIFGFNQTQRGRDAKVLYGDPNSSSSPVMLSSSTNSNSNAILGLTLDLKATSSEWTTITVDTDKEAVVEEIKNMVTAYNDLAGIIKMLDGTDEETGEKGILYNDSAVRSLMDSIDEFFYMVFDPENMGLGSFTNGKQNTWTWQDVGITLTSVNSNVDGSGSWYSMIDLDEDKLADMVASNWDVMSAMMSGERNIASATTANTKPSASFNGALVDGYDVVDSAVNGNTSKSGIGNGNGIMAEKTIAEGANTYTVHLQQPTVLTRMNLFYFSSDTSLSDFDIEFLNPSTGEWEKHRSFTGNASDTNYLSVTPPTEVSGVRIVAKSTNAADGKFRLLDLQLFEETGLASQLNQYANKVGDTLSGFLATQNTEIQNNISEIDEQMEKLQNRLDAKEESLWRKFNAMELALAKLQNQGNYFNSMMGTSSSSSSS